MKRIITLGVAALMLGACTYEVVDARPEFVTTTATVAESGTTTTMRPTTTTTRSIPAMPSGTALQKEIFVEILRDRSSELDMVTFIDVASDDEVIEWGQLICGLLTNTENFLAVGLIAEQAGSESFGSEWNEDDETMVWYGMGAAIPAFCPEHIDLMPIND